MFQTKLKNKLQNKFSLVMASAIAVIAVAGCGGGSGAGNQSPKIQFSSQVSFGDSLSDVGSYAVGGIAVLGGGRYTVNASLANGAPAPTNWTELMAAQLGQSAPCPAETGLQGMTISEQISFDVPIVIHTPGCTAYGQGGAMITNPYGPGNANIIENPVDGSAVLGQLTVPIVTQMQNHLTAHGGAYTGNEVVFILAGGNDAIFNTELYLGSVQTAAAQGGTAAAQAEAAIAGPAAVQAMAVAANQLVGYINTLVLANGAKYVVVLNLPDLSTTPFASVVEAALPGTQSLVNTMVTTYNSQLQAGLTNPDVLYVDVHAVSANQIANPAAYSLTNVTDTACNLNYPANPLATQSSPDSGTSLVCNANNVIAGDISHYEFADLVHPTPYGNILLARYVASQMAIKGWL